MPKQYRVETIILPLIDNSIYTGLAGRLGGEAVPLDALPVPPRTIFSVAVQLNKEQLLKQVRGGPGLDFELLPRALPGGRSRNSSPRASATRWACTSTTPCRRSTST